MIYSKEQKNESPETIPEETQFPDMLNKTFNTNALRVFKE